MIEQAEYEVLVSELDGLKRMEANRFHLNGKNCMRLGMDEIVCIVTKNCRSIALHRSFPGDKAFQLS